MSERPQNDDPDPNDAFDELVEAETDRDPDLAVIEALLAAFDLRTGRYTSPHVQSITERIS
ncbi:dihydrofolate synthase, partial [Streptomyces nigrescens]